MKHKIRLAVKKDMPQVLELIQELATFEKEPDAVEIKVEDLEKEGFGKKPMFWCFVAEVEEKIEGMALFYFRYSTWKGKTVHLEDLIVREKYRGKGLGTSLYKEVLKYALKKSVKRVEWVVLNWNKTAVEFYKNTGASVFTEWNTVQFEEKAIKSYLRKQS